MNSKLERFNKRTKRVRGKISKGSAKRPRLSVYRSNKFIYVQLIDDAKGQTLASSSSKKFLSKEKKAKRELAVMVGEDIAKKAKAKKISSAIFDRGGYKYQGIIKVLAESARKAGLEI